MCFIDHCWKSLFPQSFSMKLNLQLLKSNVQSNFIFNLFNLHLSYPFKELICSPTRHGRFIPIRVARVACVSAQRSRRSPLPWSRSCGASRLRWITSIFCGVAWYIMMQYIYMVYIYYIWIHGIWYMDIYIYGYTYTYLHVIYGYIYRERESEREICILYIIYDIWHVIYWHDMYPNMQITYHEKLTVCWYFSWWLDNSVENCSQFHKPLIGYCLNSSQRRISHIFCGIHKP